MNGVDANLVNADWTKRSWDLPTDINWYLATYGSDLGDWYEKIKTLPVNDAMPDDLRANIEIVLTAAHTPEPERRVTAKSDPAVWGDIASTLDQIQRAVKRGN